MAAHEELKYPHPSKISFSPDNPRGEEEEQIKKSPRFKALVTSIKEHGVLLPLIVKRDEISTDNYILVDGERRLIASREAELDEVPILIANNEHDGRILAYQVHMLREDWSKITETKAIKKIISDIKEDNPDINDGEIRTTLKNITVHTNDEISDLMKLIKYDEKTIEKAISGEIQPSHLIQIESSFISRLKKKYPVIIEAFGEEKIRKISVQKVLNKLMGNTRFLMDEFKVVFEDIQHKEQVENILGHFLKTKTKDIKDTLNEYNTLIAKKDKEKQTKKKKTKKKARRSKKKKPSEAGIFSYRDIAITTTQQTRFQDIKDRLENIGGSLSDEEYEYISEAVFCLKIGCLKAATLMVWAAGISRILKYIDANLKDFNKAAKEMKGNPKSVYKHLSTNFQYKATSIEEIRESSKDRQLMCYLYYKKLVKITDCRKLLHNYDTRCDCAHPTDITLRPNEVISIFENVYDLILVNKKLQ